VPGTKRRSGFAGPVTGDKSGVATALLYGLAASSSFIVGVLIGLVANPPRRVVASVTAFGAGVLVSALSFELMQEAFAEGGAAYVITGFLTGAVLYVLADVALERMAARSPKRTGRDPVDVVPDAAAKPETPTTSAVAGTALLVGALLDGIPENAAIGVSLHADGQGLGVVLLAAVFMGNVPESLGSTASMREEGRSRAAILGIWSVALVACTAATVLGYALLGGLSADWIAAVLALAAGGILAMLADTMMPEAFEHGGPLVALATAVGFVCAISLSVLTR
jgi:zinc transporter, ZIP family